MTVVHRLQNLISTQREAWVEINISALERNYTSIKDIIKTNIMAVVKADAYGHGSTTLSPVLQSLGVQSFGVATVDEGISLRTIGIKVPIIILGATPSWAYENCYKYKLTISVYSKEQSLSLKECTSKTNSKLPVQIKIDTGMNRLGIDYKDAHKVIEDILSFNCFEIKGIFSHLSSANDIDFSRLQKERYEQAIKPFEKINFEKHLANSYAAINYPDFRYDLVRIGIALYGQEFNFLEPVLSVKGRITRLQKIKQGDSVSYNRTWTAKRDSLVATVPIGYADGIDKKLSNSIHGYLNNLKVQQIGNITMDQMMLDVTEVKSAKIGDVISLVSPELPISNWANILGTTTYELICRLKLRLPRIYTRN